MNLLIKDCPLGLLLLSCLCSLVLSSQDDLPEDYKAPYSEQPKLKLKFKDDFNRDSRSDYQISGEKDSVTWEQGKLSLGDGAILQRKLDAGSWLEMEMDLEFPELTEDGRSIDLKVWMDLEDATDSFIWFRQKRENRKTRSAIFIVDTEGAWTQKTRQRLVAQLVVEPKPLANGQWKLVYRNGLWTIKDPQRERSWYAYIENGPAAVKHVVCESLMATTILESLHVKHSNRGKLKLSANQASQLTRAKFIGSRVTRLHQMGQFSQAIPLSENVARIRKTNLGVFHPEYSMSINNLAILYREIGAFDKAKPLLEKALQLRGNVQGEEHPDYASGLNELAFYYSNTGALKEAEPLYLQALKIRQEVLGDEHPSVASSINNLAIHYQDVGAFGKAKVLLVKALQIREKVLGTEHPATATSLNNLASLYQETGDYEQAEPLLLQAMNVRRKVLGKEHPVYAGSLNNLGLLYTTLSAFEKAEAMLTEAARIQKKVLGEEHPDYISSLDNLAGLYQEMGSLEQAEPLFLQAMKVREKVLGIEHPEYAFSLNNLADFYTEVGAYEEAEPLLVQAVQIRQELLGNGHPHVAASLNNLAGLYQKMGDVEKAESFYLQAMRIIGKAFGKEHPNYLNVTNNLATLYSKMGDFEKAKAISLQAVQIGKKVFGNEHPGYARKLNNLASIYEELGEFREAESLYREALKVNEKALGNKHPEYASILTNLALLFHARGQLDRAEPLYLEALQIDKNVRGETHPDYASSINSLARLYQSLEANDKAARLFLQSLQVTRQNLDRYAGIQGEQQQQKYASSFESRFSEFVSIVLKLDNRGEEVWEQAIQWKGISLVRQKRNLRLSSLPITKDAFSQLKSVRSQMSKHLQADPTSKGWKERTKTLGDQAEALEKSLARLAKGSNQDLINELDRELRLPDDSCLVDFRRFTNYAPDTETLGRYTSELHYLGLIRKADNSVEMLDLGSAAKIEDAISRWRSPIERANRDGRTIDVVEQKAMDKAGLELRKLLWEPLEKHIADTELVIVSPDGALGRLPLIALPGKKPRTYLLEEKKIVYLPVPALLPGILAKSASSIDPSSRALLLGDIDYGKEVNNLIEERLAQRNLRILQRLQFSELKNSGPEIDGIETLFGQATKLSSKEATELALQQQLKDHSLLHIATHGFFQSPDRFMKNLPREDGQSFVLAREQVKVLTENPNLLSGLALANANAAGSKEIDEGDNDGILYSAEIAMLPMEHVELAVLSACETSLGTDDNPGEGLIGIQRAFQVAGAKSTIASYWKVNDKATQMLMNRFYKNLIEYSKKAKANNQDPNSTTVRIDALRDAQLWMLRGLNKDQVAQLTRGPDDKTKVKDIKLKRSADPKSSKSEYISHPRYWAAFVLSGDWR